MTEPTDNLIAEFEKALVAYNGYQIAETRELVRLTRARLAAALEVSSRTVAPSREAAIDFAESWYDRNAGSGEAWTFADLFDAMVDADFWQPVPVIDRDTLIELIREANKGAFRVPDFAVYLADALLASGVTSTMGHPSRHQDSHGNEWGVES